MQKTTCWHDRDGAAAGSCCEISAVAASTPKPWCFEQPAELLSPSQTCCLSTILAAFCWNRCRCCSSPCTFCWWYSAVLVEHALLRCLLIDMMSNSCGLAVAVLRQAEQAWLSSKPWAKLTVQYCSARCCAAGMLCHECWCAQCVWHFDVPLQWPCNVTMSQSLPWQSYYIPVASRLCWLTCMNLSVRCAVCYL